jgi:hypothetical protein
MGIQRETIPAIARRIAGSGIATGLILGGSVRYGYERPDSDLDLFAIGEEGLAEALVEFQVVSEKNGCKVLELRRHPFPVHVAYWSIHAFDWVLETLPHMTYPLLDGEIIYDPARLAERCQTRVRDYFHANPELEIAWVKQLGDLRQYKTGASQSLEFPAWSDFLRHLESTYLKGSA